MKKEKCLRHYHGSSGCKGHEKCSRRSWIGRYGALGKKLTWKNMKHIYFKNISNHIYDSTTVNYAQATPLLWIWTL